MDKEYTITKEEGIRRMCEAIRESYAISDAIDDEHLATNSTFSSVKIDSLLSDIDERVDKLENSSTGGGSGSSGSITIDSELSDTSENPVQNKVIKAGLDEKASKDTMTGATSSANGVAGLVPAPTVDDTAKFLRGDGTWGLPDSGSGSSDGRVSTVNGIESINGNIALTQSLVPSDGMAYQMPYYIQSGTLTAINGNSDYTSVQKSVTFPQKYKSTPILLFSSSISDDSWLNSTTINYINLTNQGFKLMAHTGSNGTGIVNVTVQWIALGVLEDDTNG